jgi:cytochrome c553
LRKGSGLSVVEPMKSRCHWRRLLVIVTIYVVSGFPASRSFGEVASQHAPRPEADSRTVASEQHVVCGLSRTVVITPDCAIATLTPRAHPGVFQEPALATRSVWDGVFTEEQARRGEAQYTRVCEACHGTDLSGNDVDEIPALAWEAFLTRWNGRTAKELVELVKRSMPKDNPASLSTRTYVDVVAYIFQVNKFPRGTKELSLNPDTLNAIVIEKQKR